MALKVFVDAGHGGMNIENGAVANGYIEKDLNLKLALLLEKELLRQGFDVGMSRRTDIYVDLGKRGQMAKDFGANTFISVHFNSFNTKAKGCEIIYSLNNKSAQWIADCVLEEVGQLKIYKRGTWSKESTTYPGKNYYGVLRNSENIPGIIAEGLFLDNVEDIQFLKDVNFLENLAIAYTKGICKAWGISYINKTLEPKPIIISQPIIQETYDQQCMKFLKEQGFIKSDHKSDELITMTVFGAMMKNYFEKNNKL